jgi:two-component system chemotaxis response regulator CheY
MISDENFNNKLRCEFIEEAKEIAGQFEDILMGLDRNGVDSDPKALATLFRFYHTIKGSAYTAGFEVLGQYVHKVENLLSDMREGHLILTPGIIDTLLRSNDILKDMLDSKSGGLVLPNTDELDHLSQNRSPKRLKEKDSGFHFFEEEPTTLIQHRVSPEEETMEIISHNLDLILAGFEDVRVLICDDDDDIRDFLSDIIAPTGIHISMAKDGLDALEKLKYHPVDLVLSDVRMPRMDGITFVKEFRKQNKTTAIVMISGHAKENDLVSLINLQVSGFITKPFEKQNVLMMVHAGLKYKKMKEAIMNLSNINYQAYMVMSKCLAHIDAGTTPEQSLRNKMDFFLDEIGRYVNDAMVF